MQAFCYECYEFKAIKSTMMLMTSSVIFPHLTRAPLRFTEEGLDTTQMFSQAALLNNIKLNITCKAAMPL